MRNEHHHDNFSHNTVDVASHNRLSVKADLIAASSTAITIAVVFCIILLTTTIVYLALTHMALLNIIVIGLPILGCFLLLFKGINHCIREIAKTRAVWSYQRAQHLRNNLIEIKPGVVVLYDPHEQYRVENAREIAQTYHINEKPQAAVIEATDIRRPGSLSQLLRNESDRYYAHND